MLSSLSLGVTGRNHRPDGRIRTVMKRALFCLALVALPCAPARAAVPSMVVTADAFVYVPGDASTDSAPLRVFEGTTVLFAPMDTLGNHTVTSDLYVDGAPAFTTALIGPGQVDEVHGLEWMPIGTYEFRCSVHDFMRGRLEVVVRPG